VVIGSKEPIVEHRQEFVREIIGGIQFQEKGLVEQLVAARKASEPAASVQEPRDIARHLCGRFVKFLERARLLARERNVGAETAAALCVVRIDCSGSLERCHLSFANASQFIGTIAALLSPAQGAMPHASVQTVVRCFVIPLDRGTARVRFAERRRDFRFPGARSGRRQR
jgi:hypothetical protein